MITFENIHYKFTTVNFKTFKAGRVNINLKK